MFQGDYGCQLGDGSYEREANSWAPSLPPYPQAHPQGSVPTNPPSASSPHCENASNYYMQVLCC